MDGLSIKKFRTRAVPALLIYLANHRNQALQRESLLALLWPGLPQKSAQGNLRHTIYHLRQAVPEIDNRLGPGVVPFLLADRQTVQIHPDGLVETDVATFTALSGRGATAADLETAAGLYRGEFLADFHLPHNAGYDEWIVCKRAEYQRQALALFSRLADSYLETKNLDKSERYARRQLTIDDLREEAHRQLMMSLFLSGHRAAALTQYELCRQRLLDELGIQPGEETSALYQKMHSGEFKQQLRGSSAVGKETGDIEPDTLTHNLPRELTPFIGRESDLTALLTHLADPDGRLITIIGPGGIGKTRLALAAAERLLVTTGSRFADGIFFISLRSLESSNLIYAAIADALHFRMQRGENPLLDFLSSKRVLLILDNFEHLLEGAELVSQILQAAPQVVILVTSRAKLQLLEEQLLLIHGLGYPEEGDQAQVAESEAEQLFIQTARRMRSDFSLAKDDLSHLQRICRLVEGMPLALELAAAWTDTVSLADIADEIQGNIDILETKWRNVPTGQHSIRAVFDGSWQQLNEQERSLFGQLSIFRGAFRREAALAVTGASIRELARLVNKSLLRFSKNQNHYSVHGLLRQYGGQKLGQTPSVENELREKHSQYYNHWLSQQFEATEMKHQGQMAVLDTVQAELENARAAWFWALNNDRFDSVISALDNIGRYYKWRGGEREGRRAFQIILDILSGSEHSGSTEWLILRTMALTWQSHFTGVSARREHALSYLTDCEKLMGKLVDAGIDIRRIRAYYLQQQYYNDWSVPAEARHQRCRESLALFKEANDPLGCADALLAMARSSRNQNRITDAHAHIKEDLKYRRSTGDLLGQAAALTLAGNLSLMSNQYQEAEDLLLKSLDIARNFDHEGQLGLASGYLGQTYQIMGRYVEAHQTLDMGINYMSGQISPEIRSGWLNSLGFTDLHLGHYEEAAVWANQALKMIRGFEYRFFEARSIALSGSIDLARGLYDEANQQLQAVEPFSSAMLQTVYIDDGSLVSLGIALLQLGRVNAAHGYFSKALEVANSTHRQDKLMYALSGIALLKLRMGDVTRSVELYALASRYPFVGKSRWFEDVAGREITAAAESLAGAQGDAAWSRGKQLDLWPTANELLSEVKALK